MGDFNIATSSLHALSNSMTLARTEPKLSPHSSPRLPRRGTTTAQNSVTSSSSNNDVYSQQQSIVPTTQAASSTSQASSTISLSPSSTSSSSSTTPASTSHNINGNIATHTNIVSSNNNNTSNSCNVNKTTSNSSNKVNVNLNRMSAPLPGTSGNTSFNNINKAMSKALSADTPPNMSMESIYQDPTAPPLPPRKSTGEQSTSVNRLLKPQLNHSQINILPSTSILCNTSSSGSSSSNNKSNINLMNSTNSITNLTTCSSRSSENITTITTTTITTTVDADLPQTSAPPIPKHNCTTSIIDTICDDIKITTIKAKDINDDLEKIIVGPAATITGIIDTRPLECRIPMNGLINLNDKNDVFSSNSSSSNSLNNGVNNVYQFKINNSNQSQLLHQQLQQQQRQITLGTTPNNTTAAAINKIAIIKPSKQLPVSTATTTTTTTIATALKCDESNLIHNINLVNNNNSVTNNKIPPKPIKLQQTQQLQSPHHIHHNHQQSLQLQQQSLQQHHQLQLQQQQVPHTLQHQLQQQQQPQHQQKLLYENVTININKDCNNVPYENINLEYIARLMNEGYSKENVVTALGISRNNIEMACDILHEFVNKNGSG